MFMCLQKGELNLYLMPYCTNRFGEGVGSIDLKENSFI
jgi:hypothetical protein